MLNLEQVRALEARVEKAVVLITKLRQENADQERRLADAAKSEELLKSQNAELERQLAVQARAVTENSSRLEGLVARAKEAEEKAAQAELRAAEAEERAAAMERKAQAADDEIAHYRERALTAERRVADLESKAEELKSEQDRIEQGLIQALSKLDSFEDMVLEMSLGSNSESAELPAQEQETASRAPEETRLGQQPPGRKAQDTSESDQGGGSVQEPDENSQPDLESQDAPFRGGENELDIF
ncbi:MAG: hypothetical protein ABFC92_06325 [Rectinema sp.]|jgi:chromosome segregation ATPase